MHSYTSEGHARGRVYLLLVVLSVFSARWLNLGLEKIPWNPPWWVEIPSVLGFWGLYWKGFDLFGWRAVWLRRFLGVRIPVLKGDWSADLSSEWEGSPSSVSGEAVVRQTWSKLSVAIRWPESRSRSVAAVLQPSAEGGHELIYQYLNFPDPGTVETMEIHRGTAWLLVSEGGERISGEYFSGRGRRTGGGLALVRTSR